LIRTTFQKCNTKINMSFPIKIVKNNFSTEIVKIIDDNNFNVSYDCECGFNFEIKLKKMENEFENKNKQLLKYCYFSIIECIFYYFFTTFINCEINKNENYNNSICVYFLMINILWHSYNTISNINFGLKFANYILNFFLISMFQLFSFAIFDLRLIYTYWKLKLHQISQREYLKQKVKYYIVFFLLFFFSFFTFGDFYYNYNYIFFSSFLIWTVQIFYNVVTNNKIIFPLSYIILITVDRLYIPVYFRGIKNNFFQTKTNLMFVFLIILFNIICIIFLYLQINFGPRFFLPEKYQEKKLFNYKSKEDLLKINKDFIKEQCVICLLNLFNNNNNQFILTDENNINNSNKLEVIEKENSFNSLKTNDTTLKNSENLSVLETIVKSDFKILNKKEKKQKKKIIFLLKNIIKIIKFLTTEILFKFYRKKIKNPKKMFILTQCHHVFHSDCLEMWLERKKICPNCRNSLKD